MASLQFTPIKNAYFKIDVGDIGNTLISVPIKHDNSHKRCKLLETGGFLDSMAGEACILNYDESSKEDKKDLKNEGYVGYLSNVEGIEADAFIVQIHVSKEEFNRITTILSNGNNFAKINIETPLHGKELYYGTAPDDPIEWSTKINDWVHIEKCDFTLEFLNNNEH